MANQNVPENLGDEVRRIVSELLKVPQDQKLDYLKQEVLKLPPELRDPAETLILQTEVILVAGTKNQDWEKIAIFAFGVFFVLILVTIALFVKNPTQFQIFIFRVVLALAGAGIGALIPGFLNIETAVLRNTIRAGGALAIFVIIYLLNPPNLLTGH
jgi:hypothetical protein